VSNLSDLLPAGAAAKQLTFTDSGSGISSKAPVALNSDGTVSAVGGQTFAIGTPASMSATLTTWYVGVTYHTAEDKIVVLWIEDTSRDLYLQAGTVSGTSITWGSATLVDNGIYSNQIADICYDSNANCLNYSWVSSANVVRNECATLSGTTFTRDNSNTISVTWSAISRLRQIFDPTNNKVALALVIQSTTYGEFYSISISGTTPTASASLAWSGTSGVDIMDLVHDPDEQRVIIGFTGTGSAQGGVVLVDQSSSTPTASSITQYQATDAYATQVAYDTTNDKLVIGYYDNANSGYTSFIAGTVNASGGTVSFGTKTTTSSALYRYPTDGDLIFDPANNILLYSYVNGDTTSPSDYGNYLLNLSLSGTTVSVDGQNVLDGATGSTDYWANGRLVYDPDNNKPFYIYRDVGNSNYGYGIVITPGFSNVANFVGVADSAISASAAGSVIVQGGTVSGVSSGTGLSLGTAAEVDGAGNSVPQGIVYDSNENKIVVVFQDAGASYSGAAAVGTVSGTSISFGTPVTFDADGIYYAVACFDSSNNKVVIAYADTGNSNYLTAIVGTVSGTSISYGSPVVVESSSGADYKGIAYDANAQKVVIGWRDAGNSNYGSAIVGTVSGTSISFGTKAAFNSAAANVYGVTYDSNAQKVVFSYRDDGTGSGYGRSIVGTVSGTGISFGSATTFDANSYSNNISSGYDSTNNKVIVVFRDQGNSNYGTARVGTVSGTSISFGTAAVFNTEDTQGMSGGCVAEDVNAQKIIIAGDGGTSGGMVVSGTVSGTDITFDTPITTDVGAGENKVIYDSSSNKVVLTYQAESDSYKCVARMTTYGDLPLTVGTKYYVTTSGGFSSSADTPSVNAGLAISTTSLLLNGDS
jgi:hypothetical protein